jgi:hypothetical protein
LTHHFSLLPSSFSATLFLTITAPAQRDERACPASQLQQRVSLLLLSWQKLAMSGIPPPPRDETALREWFSQLNIPPEQFHADCDYLFGPEAFVHLQTRQREGRIESRVIITSNAMGMYRGHEGGIAHFGFGDYWMSYGPILNPTLSQVIAFEFYWIHDTACRIRADRVARGYQ